MRPDKPEPLRDFLVPARGLDVAALARLFDDATNSYKHLFFRAILDEFRGGGFTNRAFSLARLAAGMLAAAWYPCRVHRLSLGVQDDAEPFDLVAVDIPIGLLDAFEIGGRCCDRNARMLLGVRGSSVFPAPVRPVLAAPSYVDACDRSRKSAPAGKAISKQSFAICGKIAEVDHLLRARRDLLDIVREVHPEVCFLEMTGAPMPYSKRKEVGWHGKRFARVSPTWTTWSNRDDDRACRKRTSSTPLSPVGRHCDWPTARDGAWSNRYRATPSGYR